MARVVTRSRVQRQRRRSGLLVHFPAVHRKTVNNGTETTPTLERVYPSLMHGDQRRKRVVIFLSGYWSNLPCGSNQLQRHRKELEMDVEGAACCSSDWISLCEFCMYDIRVLMPVVNVDPHLPTRVSITDMDSKLVCRPTFRNVLRPARILPPIHVLYFRSGGAKILIRMSLTASRCTSCNNLSPKPLHKVDPPDSTMLPNRDFRRSMSARLMASTTIW